MDVRVCRNGHTTPILRLPNGGLRCLHCERARCKRYVMPGQVRERKRAYDMQYGREKRAGWR